MRKKLYHSRIMSALFMMVVLFMAACSDGDYDFDEVDSTIGLGGDALQIPVSSTEEMKLSDILELEADGSVAEAENGDYVFRRDGGDISAVHPFIEKVVVAKRSVQTFPIRLTYNSSSTAKGVMKASGATVSADGEIFSFVYQGDKPQEVKELVSATIDEDMTLRVDFPAGLENVVKEFQKLVITLPEYMSVHPESSSSGYSQNVNVLTFTNVPTNRPLVINSKKIDINFKAALTSGNSISIDDDKVTLKGVIRLAVSGAVSGAPSTNMGSIGGELNMSDFVLERVSGRFDPKIDLYDLGTADVTGVPDFLKGGNVVVDIYNPQISLDIYSDLDVEGFISGQLIAEKDGAVLATVNVNDIPAFASRDTKICICRHAENISGYDHVIEVPNLSQLIRTIPDRISFKATARANSSVVSTFWLGHEYSIRPSYSIDAPIAFAEDALIEYRDTLDDWNEDIKKFSLADDAYIQLSANVESCVPAYLSVDVIPVDVNKNVLGKDEIDVQVDGVVEASKDGQTRQTSPLNIKIVQTGADALKKLDGLIFVVSGKADGAGGTVTGITLNAQKHTLRLNDIKVRVVGKVIGDFN